jgi:circadian clock protein KaiC
MVKMRGGNHSKEIREYDITSEGLQIGQRLRGYRGLITGVPEPLKPEARGEEGDTGTPGGLSPEAS